MRQRPSPAPISVSVALVTIVAAFVGNLALRQTTANTAVMTAFVAAAAAALIMSEHIRTTTSRFMLFWAVVFGGFVSLRTEPRLLAFNLIAAGVLAIGAATFGRGGSVRDCGPVRLAFETLDTFLSWTQLVLGAPSELADRVSHSRLQHSSRTNQIRRVVVGAIVAVPIVAILGSLLASADAVFASFVDVDATGIGPGLGHVLLTALVATGVIALQRKASRDAELTPAGTVRVTVGSIESAVILGSVNALFALFAAAQFYALSGAAERILAEADLTAKDYARQGFFQLLWVAGLTLVLLGGLFTLRNRTTAGSENNKIVTWLSYLSAILTMGIVAVAIGRLSIYIEFGGLTPLRLYSLVFSIWIAVAFAIVMVRVSGLASSTNWLTPALLSSGLVVLLGLNVANPEAIIANYNVERHVGQSQDAEANAWSILGADRLSSDGQRVLINRASELSPGFQQTLKQAICVTYAQPELDRGLLDWNRSDSAFQAERKEFCA